MSDEGKVKSLIKALKILDCFTVQSPELGITEISEKLGLYKSNVHNIADTFLKAGYLEQNQENGKYRLGFKLLEFSNVIHSNIDFRTIVLPLMQELSDFTNETVYLGTPRENEVVYLDSTCPRNQLSTRSMLGVKAPLYCTGIGKAMLAYLPDDRIKAVIDKGLIAITDSTITSQEALILDLQQIRARGYSIDHMEHEYGIKCMGMPIRNKKREVIAGVSIAGPSLRFDDSTIENYAVKLRQVVSHIEDKL
ncbi:IclR family transcriptional regulator [Paenibacillus sp. FSL H7-0331]|nr:IclR family transcriptional regulator [Paenibacillus sp. FSL H7-0331]